MNQGSLSALHLFYITAPHILGKNTIQGNISFFFCFFFFFGVGIFVSDFAYLVEEKPCGKPWGFYLTYPQTREEAKLKLGPIFKWQARLLKYLSNSLF